MPLYLAEVNAVVFGGMPPYTLWMRPAPEGVVPPYRTDAGCFLVAEQFGCKAMIFVKDENGLYTANPKTSKTATFIPKISVAEMKASVLQDSIFEFTVLDLLASARYVREVHDGGIEHISTLLPGLIWRADRVVSPIECISHDAGAAIKRLCRQSGKSSDPLRTASLSRLLAALARMSATRARIAAE